MGNIVRHPHEIPPMRTIARHTQCSTGSPGSLVRQLILKILNLPDSKATRTTYISPHVYRFGFSAGSQGLLPKAWNRRIYQNKQLKLMNCLQSFETLLPPSLTGYKISFLYQLGPSPESSLFISRTEYPINKVEGFTWTHSIRHFCLWLAGPVALSEVR